MFDKFDNYEQFMGRWSRLLAPRFLDFAGVDGQGKFLDVGTGTGALAAVLLKEDSVTALTGIDPSADYVAFASRQLGDSRAEFETGDAQEMRFADASFDASLSLLVVNFIPDAEKAAKEMRRVTKSGGVVAAAVWDYGEGMEMLRIFWDEAVQQNQEADRLDERHMPYCTEGELRSLWLGAGFRDVTVEKLTIDQRFASFDDYWQPFLRKTGPAGAYVASLDETARAELRERLRRRLTARGSQKSFVLQGRALAVRGLVP